MKIRKKMIPKTTKINIFSENEHSSIEINERKALQVAKKILRYYLSDETIYGGSCLFGQKFNCISFDILYTDNEKTHSVNKEYRDKDYIADIITFAIFADTDEKFIFDGEVNLGEFIISLDKVKENHETKNTSMEDELYFLISHGIMHLLGFDHQTMEDYNFVIDSQKRALESIKAKNTEKTKNVKV